LQFAHVDLELHRTPVQDVEDWEFTVDRRVSERYAVTRRIPEDRFLCSFAHIFGGGYSAGYYR
jgi:oligopeptidase A